MIQLAEISDLENVLSDIENKIVWLLEEDGRMVGTVTRFLISGKRNVFKTWI